MSVSFKIEDPVSIFNIYYNLIHHIKEPKGRSCTKQQTFQNLFLYVDYI